MKTKNLMNKLKRTVAATNFESHEHSQKIDAKIKEATTIRLIKTDEAYKKLQEAHRYIYELVMQDKPEHDIPFTKITMIRLAQALILRADIDEEFIEVFKKLLEK